MPGTMSYSKDYPFEIDLKSILGSSQMLMTPGVGSKKLIDTNTDDNKLSRCDSYIFIYFSAVLR